MVDNKVQLEVFEGPLDLLLYLVKKEEVSIYEVNLTKIATQFIAYVEAMRSLDLEVAGEFLVMAATLMFIKSRELLPVDQQAPADEEEDGDDPRWELIRRLVEYKKFKDAAVHLQEKELSQEGVYSRTPGKLEFHRDQEPAKPDVTLFDLINAVTAILKRFDQRDTTRDLFEDKWTVSEKIEHLMGLIKDRSRLRFSELFQASTSRTEVVVTFLAVLELIRLKVLRALQAEAFSEIEITAVHPAASGAPAGTGPVNGTVTSVPTQPLP